MNEASKRVIKTFENIDFTVIADPSEYHCDFRVYEIAAREPLLWCAPHNEGFVETDDLTQAALFLHGFIKWDACSNWHFDVQDDCMIHFCSARDAESIGTLFRELYQMATELIPTWSE